MRTVTAAVEPPFDVSAPPIDVSALPLATVCTHCASEGDPLALVSVQLLRALCGTEPDYCAANGIPAFLVGLAGEAGAFRIRAQALTALAVFLTAAELTALDPAAVRAILGVLFGAVDADSPVAPPLLWAVFHLRIKFAGAGLGKDLEAMLVECGAQEFIEACEDSGDERFAEVLEFVNSQPNVELPEVFGAYSTIHEEVMKLQAIVDVAKGKRKITFVRSGE
jgi:hypothetical protein